MKVMNRCPHALRSVSAVLIKGELNSLMLFVAFELAKICSRLSRKIDRNSSFTVPLESTQGSESYCPLFSEILLSKCEFILWENSRDRFLNNARQAEHLYSVDFLRRLPVCDEGGGVDERLLDSLTSDCCVMLAAPLDMCSCRRWCSSSPLLSKRSSHVQENRCVLQYKTYKNGLEIHHMYLLIRIKK